MVYIIKYNHNEIYAGIWSNTEGSYCYNSNSSNKKKPKVFKTSKGALNHINNLMGKIPYFDSHNFRVEEWSDADYDGYLISIGINQLKEKAKAEINIKEIYWKKVFKPVKGEVEVKQVSIKDNVCTVIYLMPYSLYEYEFIFQVDLDKEIVIDRFCNDVMENGDLMCQQIKESTRDVIKLFK